MTAGEWERIKILFDAALNLDPAERQAYLESACVGAPDIKETVTELLRNFEEAGSFLEDCRSQTGPAVFQPKQLVAGRFRVIRQIAAGGMGEVYEVFDERLGIRVALKTLRTDLVARRDAYERFKREVWIAREVPHPGICRVFELIEHTDPDALPGRVIPCITMKLLDGHDLRAELRKRRPLPLVEARSLAIQICSALQSLHDHGIVHRDLKPSNIMLVRGKAGETKVVLTDFGLARRVDQTSLTLSSGDQPGAPYFQAPELLKGDRETTASDIYALGLVLDEMVTERPAFTAESIHAIYWQKLWEKPIPASQRARNLPSTWERAILKCLESNPANRYASPQEVAEDLSEEFPVLDPGPAPTVGRFSLGIRRRKLLLWVAGSAILAGAAGPTLIWPNPPVSILLYPVTNRTGSPELAYLSKGISDELLRRLSQTPGIYVVPVREESGGARTLPKARYQLRAELSRSGGRLRLFAQMADISQGGLLLSQHWEHEQTRSPGLESVMAQSVVGALKPHLRTGGRFFSHEPELSLPEVATHNPAAFDSYFRGRMVLEERTQKSASQAMALFRNAVEEDPKFALAWAGMADALRLQMEYDRAPRGQLLREAREHAERAVALDPQLPEAQATLGAVLQIAWEWERAEAAYRRAISIHPRFARGHRWYGGMLLQVGRTEEGLAEIRLALGLDPQDYMSQSAYGFCLLCVGRPREAMKHLEKLRQEKDFISVHINLGLVYAKLVDESRGAEAAQFESKALAEAAILQDMETRGRDTESSNYPLKWSPFIYAITYAYCGKRDLARSWLDRLETGRRTGDISSITVASVHAALRENDRALDLLEMAMGYHERELTNLRISPFFRDLHNHPRFRNLLLAMRLPL